MAERPMESERYARPASTCAAELENLSTGFFDRDGRVGPTALWLKEPHSLTALSMERSEQDARESELARAAQVALEIAQVSVLCHPYHRISHRFTTASLFQVFSR